MFSRKWWPLFALLAAIALVPPSGRADHASVWKVTNAQGRTLYLGGSVHALRSTDYPLPAAYNRAFDASQRLVFEDDPKISPWQVSRVSKSSLYGKNDSLKNHLDPRTFDYLRRIFTLQGVPEEKFARLRPWALIVFLWSPSMSGRSSELGVEGYLQGRARANGKPITGLESFPEHIGILSGLSDRQAEAVILLTFIPDVQGEENQKSMLAAWRKGDADSLERLARVHFADFPFFTERLINQRNRNWIPKIERYLQGGDTYFVVVGAGHMGGPNGLLALLRARGYTIEQL